MELIKIFFDSSWNIQAYINKWLIIAIILAFIVWLLIVKLAGRVFSKALEINETEIGIGSHKIKIRPNYEDMQIAYKLWVELSTRKIGLPIDFSNDVIIEVYASWYEFFKLTRELIKDVPISKIRKQKSTKDFIDIAVAVLNEELRPHLTKWQAKFKKWYQVESENNTNISPQDLQKKFPDYKMLTKEMGDTNQKLINYREILNKIALKD